MAKKKKERKSIRTKKVNLSVEKSDQTEFPSYDEWKRNMPDWLNKIKRLIGCGYTKQAHRLLDEEKIQKKLADINDAKTKVFVLHAVAGLLDETGQLERAAQYYTDMLDIPETSRVKELSVLYQKAGVLCFKCARIKQAIEHLNRADQLAPNNISTLNCLAGAIMKFGRLEEAMDLLRKAISINPQARSVYSNLLLDYNYLPDAKSSEVFEESKKWAQIQAPVNLAFTNHDNSLDPHRKLRIGYISPDFKIHSVMYFFESLLNGHDRNKFEVYGYGNVEAPDDRTEELIYKFDYYRDIYNVDDKEVAELIRSDSIDILVDLAGHTGQSRVHVLAYKPAPIQVSYLGYPNTIGMTQIDYRLTDAIADTPDQQKYYTEKLVFLPNGFLCYNPGKLQPTVKSLPMSHEDSITFGCFNNISKLSPVMVKIWVDILNSVPNSRLMLKFFEGPDPEIRQYYYNLFAEYGLENPEERIIILGFVVIEQHLDLYNSIDIALDTYPYNGTTTTCQALLMGVPVITLAGSRHSSRIGLDILTRLEMQFFAAQSHEEYAKKAIALASKPEALTQIRKTMRQRLAASPLCNYELITSDIENAYRRMWQDYCCSKGIETEQVASRQDADYRPRRCSGRTVVDNIISADKFYRAGKRAKAVKYSMAAFDELSSDNREEPPQQLLERYNADDLQSLVFNFRMDTMAYSSYYGYDQYCRIYSKARKMNPSNPEIDLRIGLLMALQARIKNVKIQDKYIKLLEIADSKLNNERSKAVLALAKGELIELSLPYDWARIHLYPDLINTTTYVLLEQGDWFEKNDLNFFRSIIRSDDTVFDLGANVGPYSISAAARTNGKVIAVEPASETFELLNRSASQFSNMTAIHAAISDKPGTAFLSCDDGPSEEFKLSDNNETQGEEVPVVTIDDIAAEHGIESVDIIKMDVEGHELNALAGAKKVISNGSPIIFYEVKHCNDLHPELIDAFEYFGYDSYFTLPDAKTIVKYNKEIPLDGYLLNMIAIRPESLQRLEGLANIEQSQEDVLENMAAVK